jgi:hypothetical protein
VRFAERRHHRGVSIATSAERKFRWKRRGRSILKIAFFVAMKLVPE